MFEQHTTVITTRELAYPAALILAIVQSPEQLIRLNPLVISARPVPSSSAGAKAGAETKAKAGDGLGEEEQQEEEWEIEDRTLVCGCIPMHLTYYASFTRTPTGVLAHPRAAMGVHLKNEWVVGPAAGEEDSGKTRVEEKAEIWAPWGLLGYVKSTLQKAHAELMEGLERKLVELKAVGEGV